MFMALRYSSPVLAHEPTSYACPFCIVVAGGETDWNAQTDVVFRDSETTAFVCPKWWAAAPAHVVVVPNDHYENVYLIPDAALAAVYRTAKRIAAVMRSVYGCEGTSMRQHNEPGAGQEVWHFHVHVFPRRLDDRLYERDAETHRPSVEKRAPFAERLRQALRSSG
jgi:histidine triad (HIT) family protein